MTSPSSDSTSRSPMLLDPLRDRIRLKHYSIRTEQAYVQWAKTIPHFSRYAPPKRNGQVVGRGFSYCVGGGAECGGLDLSSLIVQLLYDTGMRTLEGVRLRVKDLERGERSGDDI
jgi:hypothetical protein